MAEATRFVPFGLEGGTVGAVRGATRHDRRPGAQPAQPRRIGGRQPASGFTLVELLVVVSIIALLISILLPSLKSARDQAKLLKCIAHQRGLGQSGFSFAQDHNGRFQLVSNGTGVKEADPSKSTFEYAPSGELLVWPVALAQAADFGWQDNWQWGVRADNANDALSRQSLISEEFDLPICPADRVQLASPFYPAGPESATEPGMLSGEGNPDSPDDDSIGGGTRYWGRLSYGINEDVVGAEVGNTAGGAVGRRVEVQGNALWARGEQSPFAGKRLQGNLDRIFDPSTVLLHTDAGANTEQDLRGANISATAADGTINLIISAKSGGPLLQDAVAQWPRRIPVNRHPKGSLGVIFTDFHGETIKASEFVESPVGQQQIPGKYSGNVRISPYQPITRLSF